MPFKEVFTNVRSIQTLQPSAASNSATLVIFEPK